MNAFLRIRWLRLRLRNWVKAFVFTAVCGALLCTHKSISNENNKTVGRRQIQKNLSDAWKIQELSSTTLTLLKSPNLEWNDDHDKELKVLKSIPKVRSTTSALTTVTSHGFFKPPNIFEVDKPGELNEPVAMPSNIAPEIQKIIDEGWKIHNFNMYLSDCISLERKLPDFRTDYCKKVASNYSRNLPATSVIIVFHDEGWSTLLRSVHSIINRTPAHLLTEIILVDDASELGNFKNYCNFISVSISVSFLFVSFYFRSLETTIR